MPEVSLDAHARSRLLPLLFAVALFLSASLLFWIQPLVAKQLLPVLGGTPAVWNTCLLFFQTVLLAGYAYAHLAARLRTRAQVAAQIAVLIAGAALLPAGVGGNSPAASQEANPVLWLIFVLFTSVGVPVFALSASAPLLQRWFALTRSAGAADPYFLYAASNAGSLLALLLFPLWLEPRLTTHHQSTLWACGYALLALLTGVCGFAAWRARRGGTAESATADEALDGEREHPAWAERLRWLALAGVPSSLVLGVTTYITTDVAAVPLLWTLPLALYLLTFVLAFARRQLASPSLLARVAAGACVLAALVLLSGATEPAWFLVLVHVAFLFCAALALHTRLARSRPRAARLSEYYLWIAAGGALGGAFNALVAPLVFDRTIEYPLAIVLACLLLPLRARRPAKTGGDADAATNTRAGLARDLAWGAGLCALTAALALVAVRAGLPMLERVAVALGIPLFAVNHLFTTSGRRLAAGLAGVMIASSLLPFTGGRTLRRERSFYGALRVTIEDDAIRLYHGSTLHGRQFTDAARRCEPLSYYHREGPLGSIFSSFDESHAAGAQIAVVGLGTGATAAYARDGGAWTFYELDPAVIRLARDSGYFTYLSACPPAPVRIIVGDARLRLREAADASYDLLILDAFSSDAVPVHLLTREAFHLYAAKLASGGWLALHVSNRTLDLHPVVSRLAADAGLQAFYADDAIYDPRTGHEPSQWIVLARPEVDLAPLTARDPRWRPLPAAPDAPLWRDDFSGIVSVLKW